MRLPRLWAPDVRNALVVVMVSSLAVAAAGCGGGAASAPPPPPGPPPDTSPPAVSVTAPANGASVSGSSTISANATDNVGVTGVQFKLDGTNMGAEDTAPPFSASWNTSGVANGVHTVAAVARDAAGNTTTSAPVNVAVSNAPAVLRIITSGLPAAVRGQAYSATLSVQGGAPPYTWALFGGQLPAGLSLASPTGAISGTPTVAGLATFMIEARDSAGATASAGFSISVGLTTPVNVPAARGSYVDPVTGNRVWRLTDGTVCGGGTRHQYSYWPVWNSTGTHLLAHCINFQGTGRNTAVLFRDADLAVVQDALPSGSPGFSSPQLFWSPVDPNIFYASVRGEVWAWNPFTRTGTKLADLNGASVLGVTITGAGLEYVSFDDRYFLLTAIGGGKNLLVTLDRQAAPGSQLHALDLSVYNFFDEAVLTKGNKVWVIGDLGGSAGFRSRAYAMDFSSFVEVSEAGHHAHGMLPNGTPVALKAASNRDCPPRSAAGIPGNSWRPTALILDERVSSLAQLNAGLDPLAAQVLKLGCDVPGQHQFAHFSWNNTQTDRFFLDTEHYGPPGTDSLADGILRVRLLFGPAGLVLSDQLDLLAHHRSNTGLSYWAQPRSTCNRQGTRCLFSSSMTVNTNKTDTRLDLYIVDVP